ncbi:Flavin-dependent oxidoreductase, luciferase family (includes alkanesulfonate monooxygenase SsuD and methylene tetrahydromethanopterin reductase) [Paenisporosarcina quisquiliarum]|jgi:alkanesulfonate monooxygenase SsuD/methylene tetrahydromethanopterin reductase-like flavin-dependent oxidoreductase (luciferase family)|uniref:LLM class flavin-dependent oxidoreductase n=1 Tax=Psychrobacillus TaxID=1221880 RepID=UPI0008BAC805|nr:LLM class flavin-dependent oxidoreductase [Psychrobacillus psychrodurans]MCK1997375.1 LLM class flavin-dependent oxidoreductase [Psychrobacillus psychrodurans]SEM97029.1 Flavin-dependent oxidoreductase, luciferase family (includes alkanesulfonate monooxygenase SsuD and methylene tetrahydromethanopterin reductase) [Paenisporosarcina quisquiliarum]
MEKYRIDQRKGLEFGLYTLGDHMPNPHTGERITATQRLHEIIELAKLAEQAGIDFFSVGESHQEYFATQAHTVVLAAIAQATNTIKIASSSSIISTSDPVRVYEDFATIDLLSKGRAEIVAGRASRIGLFELLGYDVRYYEELYEEKFDLLLMINQENVVNWNGQFRAPLKDASVIPRPQGGSLPIWRAVGGHPASAIKAGNAGVPMFLATLGGPVSSFKRSIEAYRDAAKRSGFDPSELPVATAGFFYAAETTQQAQNEYYPYINEGMKLSNGSGYPKDAFALGADPHNVMNIGSPQQIIEKILYQHEVFGHQRYIGQMDFGGVPFDKLMKNIELIGNEILPAIKKYTAK